MEEKTKEYLEKIKTILKRPKTILAIVLIWYIETPIIILFNKGVMNVRISDLYLNPFKTIYIFFTNISVIGGFIKFNVFILLAFAITCIVLHFTGYKTDKLFDIEKIKQFIDVMINKEPKINYSKSGDCGTANWIDTEEQVKKIKETISISDKKDEENGMILGYLREHDNYKNNKKIITVPKKTFINRNMAVLGSSGSMKSRSFVIPNILNLMKSGESMFITDPKGGATRFYLKRVDTHAPMQKIA